MALAGTFSLSPLGKFQSRARAVLISGAAGDTINVPHRLGVSPHDIFLNCRSRASNVSVQADPVVTAWNASVAVLTLQHGAQSGYYDIIAEFIPRIVQ